jgi:hypothetical protein
MFLLVSLLLLSSCGLISSQEELSVQDQAATSVAETLAPINAAETIVALTAAAKEELATPTETLVEVIPTDTPTETPPDQPTSTTAFTATLSVPMVEVSVNTNCRTGPGIVYDLISALLIGQQAEVVARSADSAYWVIENPTGSGTCWLWGFYATVEGPTAGLPVWDPPPTPTPEATITPSPTLEATIMSTPTIAPTQPEFVRTLRLTSPYMTGDDVTLLQQRLIFLGYTELSSADGVFGPKTDQAVRNFQNVNGLAVDGIVGATTWNALFSSSAKGP